MLDGGVTVPGFRCAVDDLFDGLADTRAATTSTSRSPEQR
jgi:hypothetical protein